MDAGRIFVALEERTGRGSGKTEGSIFFGLRRKKKGEGKGGPRICERRRELNTKKEAHCANPFFDGKGGEKRFLHEGKKEKRRVHCINPVSNVFTGREKGKGEGTSALHEKGSGERERNRTFYNRGGRGKGEDQSIFFLYFPRM